MVKSNSELSIEDTDSNGGLEELQGNLALAPDVDQTDAVPSTAAGMILRLNLSVT